MPTVLVVDDDRTVLTLVSRALRDMEVRVVTAANTMVQSGENANKFKPGPQP